MMRRYQEPEAPFRVLSLYSPEPLARAPEPYKVAPQASSYGRSQRKSSFAIIAETRPPSPQALAVSSRPGSPQLSGSGRLSPFRGRGFKEPTRPTARHDRRASLSQQNSPKRSQIPRPARSRSISSSKERQIGGSDAARKASPKFGRRAANRYNSSVGNGNQRRMPQKEAAAKKQLSPIQGTPTRPSPDRKKQSLLKGKPAAGSPEKINRNLLAPPKLPPGGKRFVTAKTPAPRTDASTKQGPDSPSKIPLRRGSVSNSNSNIASQPAKQLPSKPANPTGVQTQAAAGNDAEAPDEAFKVISSNKKKSSASTKQAADEDLGIVDLLKQSSGATGTSSVVNTTTTTAVQPLQIDASSILAESELVAKLANLEKQQKMEMEEKSAESQKPSPTPNKSQETEPKPSPREAAKDEKAGAKNGNMAQTMIKHFGPTANNEEKEKSGAGNNVSVAPAATETKPGKESNAKAEVEKAKEEKKTNESEKQNEANAAAGHKKTDSKSSEPKKASRAPSPSSNSADDSAKKKKKPPGDSSLKSQAQAVSSESLGSLRSTDTGVSVNTVRGVSSAKEKSGLVKRPEEIETLSGNIVHLESNGEQHAAASAAGTDSKAATRWQRLKGRCWPRRKVKPKAKAAAEGRKRAAKLVGSCWPEMRCLACKRDPKAQLWPGKQARAASRTQLTSGPEDKPASRWARIKEACRCAQTTGREGRWYNGWRRLRHRQQVAPARQGPARRCWPFGRRRRPSEAQTRRPTVRTKHSLTSVAAPAPPSEESRPKIPDVLVEHNSVMRGAIPCLPVPLAWFCLACNVLLPGSGTVLSGLFNLCAGQPRFSATASPKARFGSLIVNLIVGLSQLFTVLFCLVGWGWSIWWGVTMIRLARKYKRFRDSEAAANDPEARGAGPETATLPAPGVPATALRGMERAR